MGRWRRGALQPDTLTTTRPWVTVMMSTQHNTTCGPPWQRPPPPLRCTSGPHGHHIHTLGRQSDCGRGGGEAPWAGTAAVGWLPDQTMCCSFSEPSMQVAWPTGGWAITAGRAGPHAHGPGDPDGDALLVPQHIQGLGLGVHRHKDRGASFSHGSTTEEQGGNRRSARGDPCLSNLNESPRVHGLAVGCRGPRPAQ